MNKKSNEQEVAERIEALCGLTATVTTRPIGNAFTLIITLPRGTQEETMEDITEVLWDEGWSFTLRRDGEVS